MGRLQSLVLGVIFFLIQTFRSGFCEDGLPCQPSFDSAVFVFSVYRKTLNTGTRLGKVHLDDCGGPQKVLIQARNFHIKVDSDGTVHLNRPTTLHSGEKNFTISILGSKSERKSATVRVVHLPSPEKTPVLLMPHSSKGLKRRKRDWLIPPINIPENSRGPFPQKIVQVRSSHEGDNQTEEALEIVIFVSDQNDNKPEFTKDLFLGSIAESSPRAWSTKYKIIEGNNGGFFSVSTGPSMLEGIITTAKGLDFEKDENYTLLVTVENDAPFGALLPTSTATVTVNVVDGNDAPVFNPVEKVISKPEILKVGADLIVYTATDPDATAGKSQKMWYKSGHDPAGWLSINNETGLIKIKSPMDKDSPFVEGGRYRALILAIDDDDIPATGTGTLLIELEEVKVVK
ncbi:hypothetical protein COCON_G00157010 [Conger conger]|uniref:Cadherin domain-containing protein n=1 Tax=Conger conger TaxID=82655 RepID=A0A9Q1HUE3_CONCO|nr:hypothetical protein COCON_G00157010 [Conger conger]